MSEKRYSLKDELFNKETIKKLTNSIKKVHSDFEEIKFTEEVLQVMSVLELKERISLIEEKLEKFLPFEFVKTCEILLSSLKTVKDRTENGDFVFASYSEYIERKGCTDEYIDYSLEMLGEYTKWFSVEFSIRAFINKYPEKTYKKMLEWSLSDDVDQRRLASEGLRQKLPWAIKINFPYEEGAMPLDNLFYDNERYVVRSVANHLNDISKIDPDLVVNILSKWKKTKRQNKKEMDYLINHSLRTSIKKGHKKSLEFIGYYSNPSIEILDFNIENHNLVIGDNLEFSFKLKALKKEKLMIDYKVTYPMLNDKKSEKVFKLKKTEIDENKTVLLKKSHAFKLMTTKKLYSGSYSIRLQINGELYDELEFNLLV